MRPRLLGIGTAVPANVLPQEQAAELAADVCCIDDGQRRSLRTLYRRAGVDTRHVVLSDALEAIEDRFYTMPQPPGTAERMQRFAAEARALAAAAARQALAESGVNPAAITHLVTVSCSGFSAPGVDLSLIGDLGLSGTTERVNVGFMGCHGAINGLRVAGALAAQHPRARVLLCAVELCSLHLRYGWNPNALTANALFADGAAAVVLSAAEGATGPALLATGSNVFPDTADLMTWRIGDHGFEMHLAAAVPAAIEAGLRPWFEGWLSASGFSLTDIGAWAIHPGGPRIVESVRRALDLTTADVAPSLEILRTHGNMSSPTVLFIAREQLRQKRNGPLVQLAFGPGLAVEGAIVG